MKLKPQNTYKHLVNFTSKYESRPILTGVHVTEDGHLEATNAHILLKLYHRFVITDPYTFSPKKLEVLPGQYPDLDRLITYQFDDEFTLNQDQIIDIFNFAKSCKKKETVVIKVKNDQLTLKADAGMMILLKVDCPNEFEIQVNQEYLKIVFDFLRDTTETVNVGFNGSLKPISFYKENDFVALITPIRGRS